MLITKWLVQVVEKLAKKSSLYIEAMNLMESSIHSEISLKMFVNFDCVIVQTPALKTA